MVSLPLMLARIEREEVRVSAYYKLSDYGWEGDQAWSVDLEKHGDGLALKSTGKAAHFEDALRKAFNRFFGATASGVQFTAALAAPQPVDDEIPF